MKKIGLLSVLVALLIFSAAGGDSALSTPISTDFQVHYDTNGWDAAILSQDTGNPSSVVVEKLNLKQAGTDVSWNLNNSVTPTNWYFDITYHASTGVVHFLVDDNQNFTFPEVNLTYTYATGTSFSQIDLYAKANKADATYTTDDTAHIWVTYLNGNLATPVDIFTKKKLTTDTLYSGSGLQDVEVKGYFQFVPPYDSTSTYVNPGSHLQAGVNFAVPLPASALLLGSGLMGLGLLGWRRQRS